MLNALTIDVEEYFQAHAYERVVDPATWDRFPNRVVGNTRRLLALLAEHRVRATFFVLGWVADRHPELVRDIVAAGHEVGSHGYAHRLLYRQTRDEFAADLARSLAAIRGAAGPGTDVLGYRAPAFSLTNDSLWALPVLREQGLRYDSSLLPVDGAGGGTSRLRGGKRYGVRGASRFASRGENGLWEFPVSTVRVAGRTLPVAGGGFLRLLPLWLTRRALRRIHAEGQPAVVYLHPWEIDPDEPPIAGTPALARFRHRVNVGRTESRLRRLLRELRFAPLREVFAGQLGHA
jgi:polysaccharide deacetylase family protein (PEP-CTERM system associated)